MLFLPRRRTGPELLDLPLESYTRVELEGSLDDIVSVNRFLGDYRAVVKHVACMTAGCVGERVSVLDVGTGAADIPLVLSEWARSAGIAMEFTALDNNPETVDIARVRTGGKADFEFVLGDGLQLPFASRSFDFAICCKTLHHFSEEQAILLIGEIMRVARRGFLVLDLRRSWVACLLITLLSRIFTRNRLTRNDGPLSVLRSFTPDELAALAAQAGVMKFKVNQERFWLMVGTGEAV